MYKGLTLPQVLDSEIPFFDYVRFLLALSWHCWMAAKPTGVWVTPLSFVLPGTLLTAQWPEILIITEDSKRDWTLYWAWGLYATTYYPLVPVIQAVFNPPHCLLIQPILLQLLYEDILGDSANRLPSVKADNIHWFPLIYQARHFLLEYYQLLKPDFLLVNPYSLLLGTFVLYICLEMVPQKIHHLSKDWLEIWVASCYSSFLPFLSTGLKSQGMLPSYCDHWETTRSRLSVISVSSLSICAYGRALQFA